MSNPYVLINDELMPSDKASLLVSDLSIQRGYGVFDFFKTIGGSPVFYEEHLDRFFHSAGQMRLPVGRGRAALKSMLLTLMERTGFPIPVSG